MAAKNIPIEGPRFEPDDDVWRRASDAARRTFWRRLGEFAVAVKRDEIRRGIGVDGRPLDPVLPSSRPDGAAGKPLAPHFGGSRTSKLLAVSATPNGSKVYWRASGRVSWATILGYHADGVVHGAPIRDTIGLSPAGWRKVEAQARTLWATEKRRRAAHGRRKAEAAKFQTRGGRARGDAL